jgi:nitrile hydratase subunit alpha
VSEHAEAHVSRRARHLETLLEDRGLVDGRALDAAIDAFLAGSSPANGARLVARAWVDEEFRDLLLRDANAALDALGMSLAHGLTVPRLGAFANSRSEHHVLVCTLCSCYPIALLGPSPSWYKSEAYRSRVVRDPRSVLAEFGTVLPDDVRITVHDTSAESRYLVVPQRPAGTEDLSEAELAGLVTRDGLIGTAVV